MHWLFYCLMFYQFYPFHYWFDMISFYSFLFVMLCAAGFQRTRSSFTPSSTLLKSPCSSVKSSSVSCAAASTPAVTGSHACFTATTPSAPPAWRSCPNWRVSSAPSPALCAAGLPAPGPASPCLGPCGSTPRSGTRLQNRSRRGKTNHSRI